MSDAVGPSWSVLATSGTTTYPSFTTQDGTTTAGSSSVLSTQMECIESIVVENAGSADGTLTISDHAAGKSIVIPIPTAAPRDMHWGPYGMKMITPWIGLAAALTGTAMKVRVVFRPRY